jgi:hypothetical protein
MRNSPANSFSWPAINKSENWAWMLLFVFSLPSFEFSFLGGGVDAGIRLVQNLNFAQHPAALFTAHIPQGPLAFLQYPLPIGANLSLALIFYAIIKLGILIFLRKQEISNWQAMLLYAAIYLLIAPRLLPLALLLLLLFHEGEKSAFSFSNLASLTLVLALIYIRLSVGILGASLWIVSSFFATFSRGFAFKEAGQRILLLVLFALCFLTPYLFYSPLDIVLYRFWALLNVNAAFEAQALGLGFFITIALLLAFAFALFGIITIGPLRALGLRPYQKALAFVLVLYALLYFKSRPDAGTYYVLVNMVLMFFVTIQVFHSVQVWKRKFVWLAAALLIGEVFLAQGTYKTTELRLGAFFSQLFKPEAYRGKFHKDNYKRSELLPAGVSYLVLDEKLTDWLIEGNTLLSSPSYIPSLAQDPFLDSLNAVFFGTRVAPLYLLSQDAQEEVFASSPQSRAAFERHYKFLSKEAGLSIYYRDQN